MEEASLIIILCRSYKKACKAFQLFLEFLEDNEPWSIKNVLKNVNMVETDDDLRYIFIDYRFVNVFKNMTPDFIDAQDFFEGINDLYYCDDIIDYYDL